jgi:hypothetical protein
MDHLLAIAFVGVGIIGVVIIGMFTTAIDCLRGINHNLGVLAADNAKQLEQLDLITRRLKAIEGGAYMSDAEKQRLKESHDKRMRDAYAARQANENRTKPGPTPESPDPKHNDRGPFRRESCA